jgi:NAD-dependent SIR2 family protein deacetylase
MAIQIGTKRISTTQQQFLRQAKENVRFLAKLLPEVVGDSDLQSGREELHPDWCDLFDKNRDKLREFLPRQTFEKIEQTVGERNPCDASIAQIKPDKARLAFLLGAGASKPKPSDIPTVKELLPDLLTRAKRLDRADLGKLVEYCESTQIDNIEDLLTAAQLSEFCGRNPAVLRLVDFLLFRRDADDERSMHPSSMRQAKDVSSVFLLQDTLQVLFGLLSSRMLPAQPNAGHMAIANYLQHQRATIITTNYDCCMDLALAKVKHEFSYLVDFANVPIAAIKQRNVTPLVKLHGSLNWFYCETCQHVHLIDIEETVTNYMNDRSAYPVISVCRGCGGPRRGLLVPPLAMKFDAAPPLTGLIQKAYGCFSSADVIVVVGFSFADADLYISRMITKAMQLSGKRRIILFDPDQSVAQRLRRQLSLRIKDFDQARVIRVTGDCSQYLPLFLTGQLPQDEKSKAHIKHEESKEARSRTKASTVGTIKRR